MLNPFHEGYYVTNDNWKLTNKYHSKEEGSIR